MTDPISDMLSRIRNAGSALLPAVEIPHSKMKESIANVLKQEGYISAVEVKTPEKEKFRKNIKLALKYQGKKMILEGLRRVSSPGRRVYVGSTDIPRVRGGLGVAIVSTPEGVMSGNEARKKNLGGELLCFVW